MQKLNSVVPLNRFRYFQTVIHVALSTHPDTWRACGIGSDPLVASLSLTDKLLMLRLALFDPFTKDDFFCLRGCAQNCMRRTCRRRKRIKSTRFLCRATQLPSRTLFRAYKSIQTTSCSRVVVGSSSAVIVPKTTAKSAFKSDEESHISSFYSFLTM